MRKIFNFIAIFLMILLFNSFVLGRQLEEGISKDDFQLQMDSLEIRLKNLRPQLESLQFYLGSLGDSLEIQFQNLRPQLDSLKIQFQNLHSQLESLKFYLDSFPFFPMIDLKPLIKGLYYLIDGLKVLIDGLQPLTESLGSLINNLKFKESKEKVIDRK